jgi:acetyl-CoA synthetase
VTVKTGVDTSDGLKKELVKEVRKAMGPIATPEYIHFADALPKTRSGKIMRRILKAVAEGHENVGDTSTLADPSVVDRLLKEHLLEEKGR